MGASQNWCFICHYPLASSLESTEDPGGLSTPSTSSGTMSGRECREPPKSPQLRHLLPFRIHQNAEANRMGFCNRGVFGGSLNPSAVMLAPCAFVPSVVFMFYDKNHCCGEAALRLSWFKSLVECHAGVSKNLDQLWDAPFGSRHSTTQLCLQYHCVKNTFKPRSEP